MEPNDDTGDDGGLRAASQRKPSFLDTMRAVAWSFFGVRKARDYEHDLNRLNPVHLVIAGVIGAAVFIGVLLAIVNWVLASGVAK
ncbi:MAG TPA: DUF2970 domain-containing protein [Burkholderiaceae bacterium]|jgi:hypothetical protein